MSVVAAILRHWRLLVAGLLLAVTFAAGYRTAASRYESKIAKADAKLAEQVAENFAQADRIDQLNIEKANAAAALVALKAKQQEVVTRYVDREVIKYVETENSRYCGLSGLGVRIHDAAARSAVPETAEPSAVSDGGAIEASNAEVISIVTSNYAACHAIRDQLVGLQAWASSLTTDQE